MIQQSRIPVSEAYLLALGRAAYNFACAEWAVKLVMEELRPGYIKLNENDTAGELAEEFLAASRKAHLPDDAGTDLIDVAHRFRNLIRSRNDLLHAHPFTVTGGEQQLARDRNGNHVEWTLAEIREVAEAFEECALAVGEVHQKHLSAR